MPWWTVRFTEHQVEQRVPQQLQSAVFDRFMERGLPVEAALFAQCGDPFTETFYLSPAGYAVAGDLMRRHGGRPCEEPEPDAASLILLGGDQRAKVVLFPGT